MNRLTFFLLAALLLCALSLVSAQHQARTLFVALERAQSEEKQLDIDWSRLQYQQSALGKSAQNTSAASRKKVSRFMPASLLPPHSATSRPRASRRSARADSRPPLRCPA